MTCFHFSFHFFAPYILRFIFHLLSFSLFLEICLVKQVKTFFNVLVVDNTKVLYLLKVIKLKTVQILLTGKCVKCNWENSMTFSNNTVGAETPGKFRRNLRNLETVSAKTVKKLAKFVLQNPWTALEVVAETGSAAEFKNLKASLHKRTDVIDFYHNMELTFSGKSCWNKNVYTILQIYKSMLPNYIHLPYWNQLQLSNRFQKRKKVRSIVSKIL